MFTAGDARFLQPGFDEIKYLGIKRCVVGSLKLTDGTALPAIQVQYNAKSLSFGRILGAFWRSCDPTRSAEQGQFGTPGPTIVWVASDEERAVAERSRSALDRSTRYSSPTFGPMFKGQPVLTEVRSLLGTEWEAGPDVDQGWYLADAKAYEKARKKTGRAKWFEDAYKPVTVTACEKNGGGTTCGFVYFPCSAENGCAAVLNGNL